jgi:hypothetical protein
VAKQTQQDAPGPESVPPPKLDGGPALPARRRFAGAGIASGVILTLKSPSALAGGVCMAPSGAMSGGLSSHRPVETQVCTGCPPSYWVSQGSPLPSAYSTFNKVFTCTARTERYSATPLLNILSQQSFDTDKVGMYIMAAYFNAYTGRTSFLKVPAVLAIWNEWQSTGANAGGTYTPIAGGRKWSSLEIVAYLASTME